MRFRGGISLAGGGEFASQGSTNISFGMAGIDGRIGVQINNIFGIYAQPHLSFGGGSAGATGTFAATALADFTFIDRIFVAAGGGYGLANNPSGPALHFRAGAYPLMGRSDGSIVRKGLMVGIDTRLIFVDAGYTVIQVMGAIGYEAF